MKASILIEVELVPAANPTTKSDCETLVAIQAGRIVERDAIVTINGETKRYCNLWLSPGDVSERALSYELSEAGADQLSDLLAKHLLGGAK